MGVVALMLAQGGSSSGGGGGPLPFITWNTSDSALPAGYDDGDRTVIQDFAYGGYRSTRSTHPMPDGGYVEILIGPTASPYHIVGLANLSADISTYIGADANGWSYYQENGDKIVSATQTSYGAAWSAGDIIGMAYKSGKLYFSKNGVWQGGGDPAAGTGAAFSGLSGDLYIAASRYSPSSRFTMKPSAATQTYSAPSGFFAPSS